MKKFALVALAAALPIGLYVNAQETGKLSDYDKINFYGIDFATASVIGADEPVSEFVQAFEGINNLFLTEPDKYVVPLSKKLAGRMGGKFAKLDISYVAKRLNSVDLEDMKIYSASAEELTRQDIDFELQDLEIAAADGLGLVVMAGELNKTTDYGTFYYVFFDNQTMDVIDVMVFKGQTGGIGLRNYWARSFYRTIFEVNPSKFYQSKKKIKEGVTEGVEAVKEKVTGQK